MTRTLTGTPALVRLILRRDRIRLTVWVVAVLGVVWFSAAAVANTYGTPAARAGYAATVTASPAAVLLTGPAVALDDPGGITVLETGLTAFAAITLFAMFLTVRHTRGEEEDGRVELLRATVVGRHAHLASAGIVAGTGCVVIGLGIGLIFLAQGLDVAGSLLFGASVAALGLCVTAASACLAQVTEHARGALGLTGLLLGATYVVRGVGDVQALDDALDAAGGAPVTDVGRVGTASWFSPYGWAQATRPFADDRWWPLLPLLGLAAGLAWLAVALLDHRDLGAGLVAARPGPAGASRRLRGPVTLTARLHRAGFLGWAAGLAALGAVYGSMAGSVQDLLASNPELAELFSGADLTEGYFALTLMINVLITSVFTLTTTLRLRRDETSGRAEIVLATAVSRAHWAAGALTVAVAGSAALLALVGFATGVTGAQATGEPAWIGTLTLAALLHLPACLVVCGVAMLLIGRLPRAAAAAWALVALAFVVGWLGPLLRPPAWVTDLSPFSHVHAVPPDDVRPLPLVVLTVLGIALIGAGLAALRHRDVASS